LKGSFFDIKKETMAREELEGLKKRLLKEMLYRCYTNSKFYAKKFKEYGLSINDIGDIERLQKIKFFTTKDDLRKEYPYGMLVVDRNEVVEMHASSGTTGTPVLGLHTENDIREWGEISARCLVMSGLTKDDVFQITPSLGMFSGGFGFYHGARKVGCTIVPASAGFSRRQIQFMLDLGTTMISAIVSYGFRLAEVARDMGIDVRKQTKVRKGIFGSEVWTREMKKKLADIWDMEPFDVYGFSEMYGPGMGNDCLVHDGLHIWEDFFFVEVVDPKTGDVLGPEEKGELVITTLRKEAMPLVRYRTRDVSKLIASDVCECGRTHRRYSEIIGRTDDMVKVSGVNFWPSMVESTILHNKDVGQEYRIVISRIDYKDIVRIEVESSRKLSEMERERLRAVLKENLTNVLLFQPEVVVVDPGTLPRVEVGKAQRLVDQRMNPDKSLATS
jgi:phenylacetate-CoA ligase